jgi:cytochrome c biogenesis protein CcmG, thiol:disulfide interchange protein DsbE
MKLKLAALGLTVVVVAATAGYLAYESLRPETPPKPIAAATPAAERIPSVTLPDLEGRPRQLSEWRGRPLLINFWATWCEPCRREMPRLQAAHKRHGDRIQFLGVNTKDRPDWAGEFVQEIKVSYPEVVDVDGQLLASLHSPGLPVTVALDRDGRLAGRQIGEISDQRLTELIGAASQ